MAKKTKTDCSERKKRKMMRTNDAFQITQIVIIGIIGTTLFMCGYSLIYLLVSLFEEGNTWIGYLISMIVSIILSLIFIVMLKSTVAKREAHQKKMKKCKCKPKDQILDLV